MFGGDDELELDFDRFEYEKVETLSGDTYYLKIHCRHRNTEPVRNVLTGHQVASLCLDCDIQLPASKGDLW